MNPRGLTLIEVLASVAILTMLAAATIPMLRTVIADDDSRYDHDVLIELAGLADSFIDDPRAFGVDKLHSLQTATLAWPPSPGNGSSSNRREPASVQLLRVDRDEESEVHGWLIFESGDLAICRWLGPEAFEDISEEIR